MMVNVLLPLWCFFLDLVELAIMKCLEGTKKGILIVSLAQYVHFSSEPKTEGFKIKQFSSRRDFRLIQKSSNKIGKRLAE